MTLDSITIPMPVEKARAVIWPFNKDTLKEQTIGKLMDQGLLTLKDLGFAVERANTQFLRDAAKTLLLHALTQQQELESSSGLMKLFTSGRRTFAERRQIQLSLFYGAIIGIVYGVMLLGALNNALFGTRDQSSTFKLETLTTTQQVIVYGLVALIVLGFIIIPHWLMNMVSSIFDRQMQLYRKGQLGEERVLNLMYQVLDGRWWVFQNLEMPGRNFDIDLLLVGPTGLWGLEVKSYGGAYRTVGERWERRIGGQWLPAINNPTKQATRNATELGKILAHHGVKQWISPAIVWANPEAGLQVENPAIPVWQLDQVANALGKLEGRSISEEQRDKIVEVLKGLYKEPFT